jgi:hypothetical protein
VSGTGINWKGVFFWIIFLVFMACILFWVFDWFHFKAMVSQLTSSIGIPKIGAINISGITDILTKNAALIGIATPLGITAITYAIKNWQTNKLLDASIAKANEAQLSASQAANSKVSALEQELATYKGDTTADELQKTLGSISGEKSTLENKVISLTAQIEQLQKLPSQMANELWAKSGGQTITVAGEQYKVIEKSILTVK